MSEAVATGRRAIRGFTRTEIVAAVTIYGVVLGTGIGFVTLQNSIFHRGLEGTTALHRMRVAIDALENDLTALGTNVPAGDPQLLFADADRIVFAGDIVSNRVGDRHASSVDPNAPDELVRAPTHAIAIPGAAGIRWTPPANAIGQAAEVVALWFEPDEETARPDDFALLRRVNASETHVVARGLVRAEGVSFFTYLAGEEADPTTLRPASVLPLVGAGVRGVGRTQGPASSVRAVHVRFSATNGQTGEGERLLEVSRLVDLPNVARSTRQCGAAPRAVPAVDARVVSDARVPAIHLTWRASADDEGGERDVADYAVLRGEPGTTPSFVGAVPSGRIEYGFDDTTAMPDVSYLYSVVARDCGDLQSEPATSGPVTLGATR